MGSSKRLAVTGPLAALLVSTVARAEPAKPAATPPAAPSGVPGAVSGSAEASSSPAESHAGAAAAEASAAPGGAAGAGSEGAPAAEAAPPAERREPERSDEVSVVGTRLARVAGSAHVIDEKQLQRFEYDDPHRVLQSVPGVYVRGEDGFGLRPNIGLRGVNSDRSKKVTLMEDGVLFGPAPYSAPAAYYFPLVTRMRSVRVVKGPGAIVYGPQTVGGAIDFVTSAIPARPSGMIDLAAGEYGYNKIHGRYGASDERAGFLIEGIHTGTTGFKELDIVGGNTGYERNEWMVKGSYNLDPTSRVQNTLELKLGYSDEVSNETYLGLTDDDFKKSPRRRYMSSQLDRMEWHRTSIAVTHRARWDSGLEIVTTAYRHDLHRVWNRVQGLKGADIADVLANPNTPRNAVYYGVLTGAVDSSTSAEEINIGPNDRRFVSQGVQTAVRLPVRTGPIDHRLEYGLRFHYDSIERKHTQTGYRVQAQKLVPNGLAPETTADNKAWTYAIASHVTDAMTWGPLTLTPGVRLELIQSHLDDRLAAARTSAVTVAVMPGVGAFYGLTRELGVLAGVYRGFSPPEPGVRGGKEESSLNYEAGARYASRHVRLEAIGFYNDYSNITNICTFSSGCTNDGLDKQSNGGAARIYGAEAYAELDIRPGGGFTIPVRGAYTFTQSEFLTSFRSTDPVFGSVTAGDEIPYVPAHQASGTLGLERETWALDASVTYVSAMRERAGQGEAPPGTLTDDSFLLDVSGSVRLLPWLRAYANVRNVLDGQFVYARRPFGARPNAPRWIQVGLRADF